MGVEVVENDADRDEIEMHISGHYFTACKAVWHILGFPLVTTEDCLNNHTGLYQCPHNWKVTWHTCVPHFPLMPQQTIALFRLAFWTADTSGLQSQTTQTRIPLLHAQHGFPR